MPAFRRGLLLEAITNKGCQCQSCVTFVVVCIFMYSELITTKYCYSASKVAHTTKSLCVHFLLMVRRRSMTTPHGEPLWSWKVGKDQHALRRSAAQLGGDSKNGFRRSGVSCGLAYCPLPHTRNEPRCTASRCSFGNPKQNQVRSLHRRRGCCA